MAKTYVPTLRIITRKTLLYMARWQTLVEESLTPEQITAFRDCLACLTALVAELGPEPMPE